MSDSFGAVSIAERDHNGDSLLVWSFPGIDASMDAHVLKRCTLEMERDAASLTAALKFEAVGAVGSLCWSRFQSLWIYMMPFGIGAKNRALPQISSFTVALQSKHFDPEKYGAICLELAQAYAKSGTPLKVLEGYLSILTLGSFGSFEEKHYLQTVHSKISSAPMSWVMESFGVQVVLLWTGMLLKKRIVVYSSKLVESQKLLRVLPLLVSHRDNWNLLRPYCTGDDAELSELEGVYCAALAQPLDSRQDLWDIYVDIPALSITVADHARKDLTMTSVHKDLAGALMNVDLHADDCCETLINVFQAKTTDVIQKLNILAQAEEVTRQHAKRVHTHTYTRIQVHTHTHT
jgi:hypothetical protein